MNTILFSGTVFFLSFAVIFAYLGMRTEDDDTEKKVTYCFTAILCLLGGFAGIYFGNRDVEQEKELLGVDDKGFYIKRIGTHDFIVNYAHEADNPPVHDPGCPCGWKGIVADKDTIPSNFNSNQ